MFRDEKASHDGGERAILIDAGPDLRQQALRAGLRRCDAILFTHNHVDHTFGLDEVRRFNVVQRAPVMLYAETKTHEFLRRVYQHVFDPAKNVNDSFVASVIAWTLSASLEPIELFGLQITPIRLLHGRLPVVGYRVEPAQGSSLVAPWMPLAYCTDVSAIPPESWPRLAGVKTLVLDALRQRHHPTHLTLDQAVNIAGQIGARQTWFIHMAHDLMHAETNEALPDGMALAYDGLVLE